MAAFTDYLENALVDQIFRGQAFSFPSTLYVALFTAAPSDAGGGTEVTGGSYARASVVASLANFSGTQGAGTTVASTGTTGTTSNNATITFPTATAAWGTVTHLALFDAASSGNMLTWSALTASQVVNNGTTLTIAPGGFSFQVDN
jgi:hypothetical protein